jgi:chromosome segregation ATPase
MQTEQSRIEQEFIRELGQQIEELKESGSELERKILLNQNQDYHTQEEGRERFRHDIKILDAILANQTKFLEKFEQLEGLHIDVAKSFEKFTEVQLPSLDSVVHKHIDILRVTEQDHFNKVKSILEKSIDNKVSMAEEIEELKGNLQTISNISQTIAKTIVRYTLEQLGEVVKPFEREILSLKSHAEGINTSLYESENRLATIKEQSELLMKQMILSSKKMSELQTQNSSLYDVYSTMKDLMKDIEIIKSEYVKSQSQLSMIIKDFKDAKDDEIDSIKEQMESLIVILTTKVDRSLERLHEHYHIANEDISQSVKFLSKQAQLKNSYAELDS